MRLVSDQKTVCRVPNPSTPILPVIYRYIRVRVCVCVERTLMRANTCIHTLNIICTRAHACTHAHTHARFSIVTFVYLWTVHVSRDITHYCKRTHRHTAYTVVDHCSSFPDDLSLFTPLLQPLSTDDTKSLGCRILTGLICNKSLCQLRGGQIPSTCRRLCSTTAQFSFGYSRTCSLSVAAQFRLRIGYYSTLVQNFQSPRFVTLSANEQSARPSYPELYR